ncbi:hypothetical protein CLV82_1763 [Zeaxanthinibacter enoshimensis]|uniref:Uncharacterized protein n=1 Tax=Zeaxanthinibacter enoshimensis TaxID=392009 RepID=A0A4R6TKR2_9FLAO|nr:hypothetical protein CLV82_1763 [Zeaxanthinibacter enoshimensis]
MKNYTVNLPQVFYFLASVTLLVYILIVAKVILIPLFFSFFLH